MSTTEASNKETARRIVEEAINEGNPNVIDGIFAEDYVSNPPEARETLHGPEDLKEWLSRSRDAFADIDVKIEDVIAEDDKVVQRRLFTATHDGEFRGIPATGTEVEMKVIVILRFEDGKVVESWIQSDVMGLLQQLGVFPPGPIMLVRIVAGKLKHRLPGG